jgi:RpiB/LacA/LacB family sugar-phosphate isomerase
MRVAIGCDHAGYPLKAAVLDALRAGGHEPVDCGTHSIDPVDYPDYVSAVAQAMLDRRAERGVILCGSGVGAAVAANKIRGIRACVCHDTYSAHQGVEHDDLNVLCLGGRIVGSAVVLELVHAFLGARFTGEERHARRMAKIARLEQTQQPFPESKP